MEKQKTSTQLFTIQMAAQISGLTTHTIRAWEKRYSALVPNRSQTGRRLYTNEEIARLSLLSQLTSIGNAIGQIANLPDEELKEMFKRLSNNNNFHDLTSKKIHIDEFTDTKNTLSSLILALTNFKFDIISHELNKAKLCLSPKQFALELISPLLNEVSVMVDRGLMNAAHEYAISSIIRFHIGHVLFKFYERKNKSNTKIAFATPEGDLHEFGILMSALLCSNHQHNFIYLGPNMPSDALSEAIKATETSILVLGTSTLSLNINPRFNLTDYLNNLNETLPMKVEIWIGGKASFDPKILKSTRTFKVLSTLQMFDDLLTQIN